MKMRRVAFLLILLFSFFLLSSNAVAVPLSLDFDPDAGGVRDYDEIWGWDIEGITKGKTLGNNGPNPIPGVPVPVDAIVNQDLGPDNILGLGDRFTEAFTAEITNGFDVAGDRNTGFYGNLYADIDLAGLVVPNTVPPAYSDGGTPTVAADPSTIQDDRFSVRFTSGNAFVYLDQNANQTFDPGTDLQAAEFLLSQSAKSTFTESIFQGNASILISIRFVFDEINQDADFFKLPGDLNPDALEDLVALDMVIALAEGSFNVVAIEGSLGGGNQGNDAILIGIQDNGFDARFELPEPASLTLVGFGLLTLAGLSRKIFFKK
jgi:hypothetical protein